jgi:hypothetical protein
MQRVWTMIEDKLMIITNSIESVIYQKIGPNASTFSCSSMFGVEGS